MAPLLVVKKLVKHYENSRWHGKEKTVTALAGVSFSIDAGEGLAIVGGSGCGKSTLARCLAQLETPTSGAIWLEGKNLTTFSQTALRAVRRQIQLVFQDPALSLNPRFTALQAITEPFVVQDSRSGQHMGKDILAVLEELGISTNLLGRTVTELSGGQRQRLAICRALVLKPKLLILDESFSALDCSTQARVANLLTGARPRQSSLSKEPAALPSGKPDGAALQCSARVIITHDLVMAAWLADRIAVMDRGQIVEAAAAHKILREPKHAVTRLLIASTPGLAQQPDAGAL